jgi:hypothetical protein
MQIIRIIILGLLISTNLFGQNDDWYVKYDSAGNCGYVDKNGDIMIPIGKYLMCFTDTFRTYAIVAFKNKPGFIGIDKEEKELFTVFPFDNGPDYISDGTFRIIENSKIGFADTTGKIIIQPIYDFTFGFDMGLALVNFDGHREKSDPTDPNCEYYTCTGGKWGVIDKNGKVLLDLKYDFKWNHETQKTELIGEDEKFLIENGQIIKEKK